MEIALRRYFWVINLATIALCSFLAASAVGRLVESRLPQASPAHRAATLPPLEAALATPQGRDISKILDRNIFCSGCEKVVESSTLANGSGDDGENHSSSNDAVKTGLNLRLIATLVSEEDRAWSFAAILDNSDGKTRLFAIGSHVSDNATATDVLERRVLLLNGTRHEYLDLEHEGMAVAAADTSASPPVEFQPPMEPGLEEVSKGIRKVGETTYEIDRSALNKVLGNTTLLARSARIIPSVRDGEPNGFKLYAIRPGSLYSLLGFFNGDTINAVNGHAITTPDKALEIYTKLRNASHLNISYTRRGKTVSHEYTIR